jgi:hypothetical protein
MRAFPGKERLHTGASHGNANHWPAQHYGAKEYSVVLLGVMYPRAVPQHGHRLTHEGPPMPPEILINRRSTDLIFYDPILTNEIGDTDQSTILQPNAEPTFAPERHSKPAGTRDVGRTASIEALTRDLALLFLQKRP